MNLWARTLIRQLILVVAALFFFSCEDENSILGFKNPNKKFQVGFVDIPLNSSSVFTVDSLITDLRPLIVNGQTQTVDGILVGQYQDGDFGKVTARTFLPIYPTVSTALPSDAVFDSVTVSLRLNFYAHGFTGNQQKRIAIHELTGDTLSLYNGNRYYANSPAPEYSVDPIGEATINVSYDSLKKQSALRTGQDTLLATGRLDDVYGMRLFNAIKAGATTSAEQKIFKATMRGLALIPGDDQGVLGMNVINSFGQLSRVHLHYHTLDENGNVDDTLSRAFGFEFASFVKIEADRAGTELDAMQSYESITPLSDLRYLQSGAPILTRLDLAPFYAFADTVDNILINSAEFVIDDITAQEGKQPPRALMFRLMNNESTQFMYTGVAADRELLTNARYYILSTDNYYTPATLVSSSAGSSAVTIDYKEEDNRYTGFLTLFAQSLFANAHDTGGANPNRLKYLALVPADPPFARSVSAAAFSRNSVHLRIYYTRANPVAP